jgi:hypothetical protein
MGDRPLGKRYLNNTNISDLDIYDFRALCLVCV